MVTSQTKPTNERSFRVAGLLYNGAILLDLVGPLEAFTFATLELESLLAGGGQRTGYEFEFVAATPGIVDTSIGLGLYPDIEASAGVGPYDIILVPGQIRDDARYRENILFEWLRSQSKTPCRIMSICSGALLLAESGILSGRTITTHWAYGAAMRQAHPDIEILEKKLFHKDGRLYSSGGVSSGIDLALFMIEEDFGREIALRVAKRMVVYLRRQGDQSQFSDWLEVQSKSARFASLLEWIEHNLVLEMTVESLADRCGMSPRNFARQFRRELGVTPINYIQNRRISYAKYLVETTTASAKQIAARTGFKSDVHFQRAFQRAFAITPMRHRAQFGPDYGNSGAD